MALVKCVECENEVSDKAAACPKCGAPIGVGEVTVVCLGGIDISIYKNDVFCGRGVQGNEITIQTDSDFSLTCVENANGGRSTLVINKGMTARIGVKAKMLGGVKFLDVE